MQTKKQRLFRPLKRRGGEVVQVLRSFRHVRRDGVAAVPNGEPIASDTVSARRVAYVVSELGALSGTFVYREIAELRRRGATVVCFGTRRPEERVRSQEADAVVGGARYLYDSPPLRLLGEALAYAVEHPRAVLRGAVAALGDSVFHDVPSIGDRLKVPWHAVVGTALAGALERESVGHLHAHFAHVPTSIVMYASLVSGIPFSFTGHANDVFERATLLRQKLRRCAFSSCISYYNQRHFLQLGADRDRLPIVRCGIDLEEFPLRPQPANAEPPRVLFVARLVEKKGPLLLLRALARLARDGVSFQADVVGNGPLADAMAELVQALGLGDRVVLHGAQPQERVRALLYDAAVFALPCVVTETGDRDGIPVALMEAMAAGVPVVSTRVSGIPELIEHGVSGILCEPSDVDGVASALCEVLSEPSRAETLARGARQRIEEEFSVSLNAERLLNRIARNPVRRAPSKHRSGS